MALALNKNVRITKRISAKLSMKSTDEKKPLEQTPVEKHPF
jgi:hypothetical protein